MSTLKKVLALTLALAMVLSLNVFAAFKDQDKIDADCVDAVQLMNDLGIMTGDNGYAKPLATITRAEAAAMIFRLMTGKTDASSYNGGKYFTDVVTNSWYDGYVNFCFTMGIVQGKTPTTFDPNAPVTGYEMAKMLLICCGYKADKQGYTGGTWTSAVQNDAFLAGMLENYNMSMSAPALREWVAVMMMDTLKNVNVVKYYLGDLTDTGVTLGTKKFEMTTKTGVLNSIGTVSINGTAAGKGKFLIAGTDTAYTYAPDTALLGQEVTVLLGKSNKVYSVRATSKNTVGTAAMTDVSESSTTASKYTVGTLTGSVDANTIIVKNTLDNYVTIATTAPVASAADVFDGLVGANSTSKVVAINNDTDTAIDVIIITNSTYGTYTVNATTGNVSGVVTVTKANVASTINLVNTVASGDFVKVTENPFTAKYDVEKLTANVATLMSRDTAAGKYKLGSTTFKISTAAVAGTDTYLNNVATKLGTSVEYYTDGTYVVSAANYTESTTPTELPAFVMLTAKGSSTIYEGNTTYYAKVMGLDGKVMEYQLYKTSAAKTETMYTALAAGSLYTVTKNSDGTAYLTAIADVTLPTNDTYQAAKDLTSTTKVVNNVLDNRKIASDLTVFTVSGSGTAATYGVAKVSELTKYITNYEGVVYAPTGKVASILFAKFTLGDPTTTTTTAPKALIVSAGYEEYNTTTEKAEMKVDVIYVDGTKATLVIDKDTATGETPAAPGLVSIQGVTITDGVATFAAVDPAGTGELKVVDGNYLTIGTDTKVAASSIVVVVKTSDGYSVSTLAKAVASGKTNAAKYLVDSTSGEVTFLYVDQTAAAAD